MRLTRFSDIGLRTLMYLARAEHGRLVTVSEVSRQFDLPHNHVVKVVGMLVKQGWIEATRGRHGGICLAAAPESLRVGDVLRTLEGDRDPLDCEGFECVLADDCFLRHALQQGKQAFYQAMNAYSLQQLVGSSTGEKIIQLHRRFVSSRVPNEAVAEAVG